MSVFKLPDLGEGLQEAEIVKWFVKEGDVVKEGDEMAEMSTAKAVVEVPAPFTGKIVKLHGGPGDIIKTHAPLVTFQLEGAEAPEEETEAAPKVEEKPAAEPKEEPIAEAPPTAAAGQVFELPDLGEGLQEAEIVQWFVKEGDDIREGDNMVEMSTAKAVVEVPAPFTGKVSKLYGGPGDIIKTHSPLVEIATGDATPVPAKTEDKPKMMPVEEAHGDSGTVVGAVVVGNEVTSETKADASGIKASAAVRAQARKMKVDLKGIQGTGPDGTITMADVNKAASGEAPAAPAPIKAEIPSDVSISPAAKATADALGLDISSVAPGDGRRMVTKGDVLRSAREGLKGGVPAPAAAAAPVATSKDVKAAPKVRAAASAKGIDIRTIQPTGHVGNVTMADVERAQSQGVQPVSAPMGAYQRPSRSYDVSGQPEKLLGPRRVMAQAMARANAEVCNTSIFDEVSLVRWSGKQDITVRIMRSIIAAAFAEPAINAWFDGEAMTKTIHRNVNLGIAVDSPKGLFVPVVKDADKMDGAALRAELDRLRKAIDDGTIKTSEMSGGTITLSNFGMIAGRYATPIVSPPEVAIVGIGGLYEKLVMTEKGIENQRFMPVSLTFDHRACTGGEAARFLAGILNDLALAF